MTKNTITHARKNKNTYSIIAGVFTLVLFILLALGSLFLQKKINQENQDIRQEAWSSNQGAVYLSTNPPANSTFTVNQPVTIEVLFNTTNIAIDGIQIKSKIESPNNILNNLNITPNNSLDNTTLDFVNFQKSVASSVSPSGEEHISYDLDLIAITDQPEAVFTTNNSNVILYTYTFTPTNVGTFSISFDEESFAINHLNHSSDELRTDAAGNPPVFTFTVVNPNSPCTETDGGFDYAHYGETTGTVLPVVPTEYISTHCENGTCKDYCLNNSSEFTQPAINEWACYTNAQGVTGITFERRICDYGCQNGACLPNPSPSPSASPSPTLPPDISCFAPRNFVAKTESLSCNTDSTFGVNLSWETDPVATKYRLRGYNLQDDSKTINITVPASATATTSFNFNGLAEGTWYFNLSVESTKNSNCLADHNNFSELYVTYSCPEEQYCRYLNCSYGACTNGYQSVTCSASSDSDAGCAATITQTQPCASQCVYTCTDWNECGEDHLQEKTCTASNSSCWDYSGNNRGQGYTEVRSCNLTSTTDILFASYELCWYSNADGRSVYLAWDKDNYNQVTWIDVSDKSDFSRFAHKNVENATTDAGYGVTNGQGFVWADNQSAFNFSPDVTYYARLYYRDSNNVYHHSRTVTFRMNKCAGNGGTTYKQCNESCSGNADCTSGLYCKDGACRLPTNSSSEQCINPNGLKSCAQWCADNSECQAGLTCWYNHCHNPKNINIKVTDEESISLDLERARQTNCATWTPKAGNYLYTWVTTKGGLRVLQPVYTNTETEVSACNTYCSSNAQCEMNMRCYKNACRLAVNPENDTCGTGVSSTSSDSSSSASPMPTKEVSSPSPTTVPEQPVAEQTALDAILEYLNQKGISLLTLAIIAGGVLLFLIILIIIASSDKKQTQPTAVNKITEKPVVAKTDSQVPPSAMLNDSFDQQNKANLIRPTLTGTIKPSTDSKQTPPRV